MAKKPPKCSDLKNKGVSVFLWERSEMNVLVGQCVCSLKSVKDAGLCNSLGQRFPNTDCTLESSTGLWKPSLPGHTACQLNQNIISVCPGGPLCSKVPWGFSFWERKPSMEETYCLLRASPHHSCSHSFVKGIITQSGTGHQVLKFCFQGREGIWGTASRLRDINHVKVPTKITRIIYRIEILCNLFLIVFNISEILMFI
jgi:hypothetical protein